MAKTKIGRDNRKRLESCAELFGIWHQNKSNEDLVFVLMKRLRLPTKASGSVLDMCARIVRCTAHKFDAEIRLGGEDVRQKTKSKHGTKKSQIVRNPKSKITKAQKSDFYKSWEWRTLRMEALKDRGSRCECCGATPEHMDMSGLPTKICVDHIQPISLYWHRRLDRTNLQILCDECNQGKGAWDETDWRDTGNPLSEQIIEQMRYTI